MGCYSYICPDCEEPINSDSFSGENCVLFLMKDGEIIEWMQGQYNSYGCVFDEQGNSLEWVEGYDEMCDLVFSDSFETGIAAYHTDCYRRHAGPLEVSASDPDQGWNDYKHPTEGPCDRAICDPDGSIRTPSAIIWKAPSDFDDTDY